MAQTGTLLGSTNPQNVSPTAEYPGTLLANLTHGRNTEDTFYVDDYNNGGAPATGRYATDWIPCGVLNNGCGTGSAGARTMDNVTGLVWSNPCSGTNCSNMTNEERINASIY